jgi:prolyl 4-hydroxylase
MIRILDNILTEDECNSIIELGISSLQETTTLGEYKEGYRTATGCWIYNDNDITNKIKELIKIGSDLPIENQEKIHIVKYSVGGEYKPHHDFFHQNTDYYENTIKAGGQRTHSFLFYLNDNFEGGDTEFTSKKIKISAKKGRMLIWENLDYNGNPDMDTLHAGLPVTNGEKWIAIVWVRQNKFQ